MPQVNDLSGNGAGVNLNNRGEGTSIDISVTDATIKNANRLYATGAGNVVMRLPGSNADVTVAVAANSTTPIAPGTIIRKTNTTATGMFSLPDIRLRG